MDEDLSDGTFVVLATLTAAAGRRGQLVQLALANARASLRFEDGGCLQFDVVLDIDHPDRVHLVTAFRDELAFIAHREQPHFHAWLKDSSSLLAPGAAKVHRRGVAQSS